MGNQQLSWPQRGKLWLRLGIRLVLAALAVGLVCSMGRFLFALTAPFVFALLFAAALNPAIRWLQRRLGWSRPLLTLLVLLLLLGSVGGALWLVGYAAAGELISLSQNWDQILQRMTELAEELKLFAARLWDMLPVSLAGTGEDLVGELVVWLQSTIGPLLQGFAQMITNKAVALPSFLLALVIFLMALYFLTADYPYLRTWAVQHTSASVTRFFSQVKQTALAAFGGYLKAELMLSVGVFFILLVGFILTRQSYGLLLALGLAVLDFIPIVGAGTVMVPWAVIALFTRDYVTAVNLMLIWGVIALFRRVMEPKFVGNQTGLSPILSLFSIYVGMKIAGVLGMILGPICTLVLLNLAALGIFDGMKADLSAAAADIAAILRERPGE
ncbi:MAG: sporulation integral membrane protein YtvI [Oscillospiraceae bacterium]|jgi:sporulation integral membrane protein YtvI|nr:sporulation integral membrane protein YtvI [Oscillospiraceae bacterium]MCI9580783.1 sporulation integral membrane protein YtvI [Oscillospiraceae bacterium]